MGVPPDADMTAIRAAYERLNTYLQPDKMAGNGTANLCMLVDEIYQVDGKDLSGEWRGFIRWMARIYQVNGKESGRGGRRGTTR
eukprot:283310-Chlamydomonas_euryale.AAC.12